MALKENYKDDILDVSVNTKRKYRMTENQDGTISLEDETVYTQEGDSFGSGDMNATNGKVNALETDIGEINDNLTDGIGGTTDKFRFGTDGNGNYGYIKKVAGADTFFPFNGATLLWTNPTPTASSFSPQTINIDLSKYDYIGILYSTNNNPSSEYYFKSSKADIPTTLNHKDYIVGMPFEGTAQTNEMYFYYRNLQITSSGVSFGNAYNFHSIPSSPSNGLSIPLKIYGYKNQMFPS